MWVLIITFLAYGDPASLHFAPFLVSQEFTGKATCEAARSAYVEQFKTAINEINESLKQERAVGEIKGTNNVALNAICVQK